MTRAVNQLSFMTPWTSQPTTGLVHGVMRKS